jgi:hypothetical protein
MPIRVKQLWDFKTTKQNRPRKSINEMNITQYWNLEVCLQQVETEEKDGKRY